MPSRGPRRHSAHQFLVLAINSILIVACFVGAGALVIGNRVLGDRQVTADTVVNLAKADDAAAGPSATFPAADPAAKNFLITGADNNACIDPSSPFAGAFGDRSSGGQRSDTIMIVRVDPSTNQAAVLSFQRDLWVRIAGTDADSKINAAYRQDDPTTLIQTIYDNFRVGVDHFIQIDFCAFKTLVDAVGGVPVPFAYAARDTYTGLNVTLPGCYTFNGDHALAYVRSRHYEYLDPATNTWKDDGTSDLGRVSRQQDFIRRVISKALATGVYTPSVATALYESAKQYVVTDQALTLTRALQFAGVLQNVDPSNLRSYQIEVKGDERSGQSVLLPRLGGDNMKAILAIFRGEAPLTSAPTVAAGTPTQEATTTTSVPSAGIVTTTTVAPVPTLPVTTDPAAPVVSAESNDQGIVPPRDVTCGAG